MYLIKRLVPIVGLHLLTQAITVAQEAGSRFAFRSTLSRDTILIGDQVELTLRATAPAGYQLVFPTLTDTLTSSIEVLGTPRIDTLQSAQGAQELLYSLMLTSFDSGYHRVPPMPIIITGAEGVDTARTVQLWLKVNTIPRDEAAEGIKDIKPPLSVPLTLGEIAKWLGLALLVAAIIALVVIYIIKRRRNEPLFSPLKPKVPAHIIALKELERIRAQKLWESDDPKLYYSLVTDTLRTYVEGRFNVPAMEQTSYEILWSLKNGNHLDSKLHGELEGYLTTSDLVKFARFKPPIDEKKQFIDFSFTLVNATIPAEPEVMDQAGEAPVEESASKKSSPKPEGGVN